MTFHRAVLALLLLVVSSAAWPQGQQVAPTDEDAKAATQLTEGLRLGKAKQYAEAFPYFDQVIASYERRYRAAGTKYYSARHQGESLIYLLQASATHQGSSAAVVSMNWGYAHYLKGYLLIDLGRLADAKVQLERAIALSPLNAQFLSELGHIHQIEKNWTAALATFQRAREAAELGSPPASQVAEHGRALRGMGYQLIELRRLAEAEAVYHKCLELNSNDAAAKNQLAYIQSLKAKAR